MDDPPPPYHIHDPRVPIESRATPAYEPLIAVASEQLDLQTSSASPQLSESRNTSVQQEFQASGFVSARAYFELRTPTRPVPYAFFVHTIVFGPDDDAEKIAYPGSKSLFQSREVDVHDWRTFANHLFPPTTTEGSSTSNRLTRLPATTRDHTASSSPSEKRNSRPVDLPEVLDRLSIPPTKRDTSDRNPIADTARLRRIRIEAVVAEWNAGFFRPRGLRIDVTFPEDSPSQLLEGGDTPFHRAVSRSTSDLRLLVEHGSQNIDLRNQKGETALFVAVTQGKKSAVEILLQHDADPEARPPGANSPLHTAVIHDRTSILKMLLEKSTMGLEELTAAEETPLYLAVARGQTKNTQMLLQAGASPHTRPTGKDTMLHLAISRRDSSIIRSLLEHGSDTNQRNKDGDAPLNRFVATGNTSMVKTLLEFGANPNARSGKSETPLSVAVAQGHSSIVSLLLARDDVDFNSVNQKGETPLYTAISRDDTSVAQLLLNRGADPNQRPSNGETMLNTVISHGNNALASLILDRGADANVPYKSGDTALSQAVSRSDTSNVNLLLSAGADVNVPNAAGEPILYRAVYNGHTAITSVLLAHQAKADVKSPGGETALYRAVYRGDPALSALLLSFGANARSTGPSGETCLYRAVYHGSTPLVALLLGHSADPNQANSNGETPLYRAVYRGDTSIVTMLVGKGADPKVASLNHESPLQLAIRKDNKSLVHILTNASVRVSDIKLG